MDCSRPGTSVHKILQARILEWVVISLSRGSSWPKDFSPCRQIPDSLRHQGSLLWLLLWLFQLTSLNGSQSMILKSLLVSFSQGNVFLLLSKSETYSWAPDPSMGDASSFPPVVIFLLSRECRHPPSLYTREALSLGLSLPLQAVHDPPGYEYTIKS